MTDTLNVAHLPGWQYATPTDNDNLQYCLLSFSPVTLLGTANTGAVVKFSEAVESERPIPFIVYEWCGAEITSIAAFMSVVCFWRGVGL